MSATTYHIISVLTSMKGLKFIETLKVTFTKMSDGEIVYKGQVALEGNFGFVQDKSDLKSASDKKNCPESYSRT